jgi:Glycosyl hydrolases family 6
MEDGWGGRQILVPQPLSSRHSTKQQGVPPKFVASLQTLPTITPGALGLAHLIPKETRIVMSRGISMLWHLYLLPLASQPISSLIHVSDPSSSTHENLLMRLQARNGVQPTAQNQWGDWCNLKGTGFGVRPTVNTGDALADAFVWIKPGGECDVSRQLRRLAMVTDTGIGDIEHQCKTI